MQHPSMTAPPPTSLEPGRFLMHNTARHTVDMRNGRNGFRFWTEDALSPGFRLCGCGWSGLTHYSRWSDYRCEPE